MNPTSSSPALRRFLVCALGLAALTLSACKPPKSVDFYRANTLERDKMVNHCLATNSSTADCENAITAEAERWGTKDINGFTVMIQDQAPAPDAK